MGFLNEDVLQVVTLKVSQIILGYGTKSRNAHPPHLFRSFEWLTLLNLVNLLFRHPSIGQLIYLPSICTRSSV